MTVAEKMRADEFLAMDDPRRGLQLVAGGVVVNEPGLTHQRAVMALLRALSTWTESADDRGEVILPLDVRLDDFNVYAPDLLWYAQGRGPGDDRPGHDRPGPYPLPDLAVEVRSPSTWRYDLGTKKSTYEARGLPELWLVDTDGACVLVYRRSAPGAASFDVELELDRRERLASPLLPDFALRLDALFPVNPGSAG